MSNDSNSRRLISHECPRCRCYGLIRLVAGKFCLLCGHSEGYEPEPLLDDDLRDGLANGKRLRATAQVQRVIEG